MRGLADYSSETLLNTTPDAILLVDSAGTITYANDRVHDLFGYEPDDLIGHSVERVVPEPLRDDHVAHREVYTQRPERRPAGIGLELEARRADGSTVPVEICLSPLARGDGDEVVAAVRDVTEQRRYHRQISRLRRATGQLMDADTKSEVAHLVATTATDLFGYESSVSRLVEDGKYLRPIAIEGADTVGLDDRPVYPIEDDNPVARAYEDAELVWYDDVRTLDDGYDRGDARAAMYIPIGRYGVLSVLDTDAGAFDFSDRELALGLTANAETILDRIRKEKELERQIDRLDEFAGIISHDLRNPLNVAQLRVDKSVRNGGDEGLEDAAAALERMGEIIDYTLTLARNGNAVGETEPVAVSDVATRCWQQFDTPTATLDIVDELCIQADPDRLNHVFQNLFDNAIDHCGDPVTVRIGSLPDSSGFYVEDDGPGIPEDEQPRIFERGFTTAVDGTGFGLAIISEIVAGHGWDISVTESSSGGARFEITGVDIESA